jgi:hypothetical protein
VTCSDSPELFDDDVLDLSLNRFVAKFWLSATPPRCRTASKRISENSATKCHCPSELFISFAPGVEHSRLTPVELDELVDLKMLPAWRTRSRRPNATPGMKVKIDSIDARASATAIARTGSKRPRPGFDRRLKGKMPGHRFGRIVGSARDRHRKDRPGFGGRQSSGNAAASRTGCYRQSQSSFYRLVWFENAVAQINLLQSRIRCCARGFWRRRPVTMFN